MSFLHAVENFSTLQPNVKKTVKIRSQSSEGRVISSSLYFTSCSCEDIIIEITSSELKHILRQIKFSLLDVSGNIIECGEFSYGYDVINMTTNNLRLSLKRNVILNKKSEYLPDDKFSLLCECIFSTGKLQKRIEETQHGLPLSVIKGKMDRSHIKNEEEKFSEHPSLSEDMKALYINQRFTDVILKTKTKSFKAHWNVLCTRSPVFETMMTNDMKEKNTDCIQANDLENETVEKLLLFLYSDNIDDLQWKSAIQLYYAADKYQIGKLKAMCSSFLTENLRTSNAGELLLLSDTHNDSSLKKAVEDFILEHEEQVFGSEEWEMLIETNPLLVLKTMHLKYKKKNEAK